MGKAKSLQELTLLDRFLFSVVMEDNEILEDVLEIILGYPVPLKDKAQAEKELRRTPLNKSVFFDVYERISGISPTMWKFRKRIRRTC